MSFWRSFVSSRSVDNRPRAGNRSTWNVSRLRRGTPSSTYCRWRVGDETAVPVILAVDLHGRKAGRQCGARHDMLRAYSHFCVVEVREISGADIDCLDTEAYFAGVDAVEINEPF